LSSTTSRSGGSRSDQRGQVLVLFAGGLIALLLVAALAFDVGSMLVQRRDEQNAADAAALAGARFVLADTVAAEAAAREIARINGYEDADPNEYVNVHMPAIHGRYAGLPGFIEVEVGSTRPSIFAGVIGRSTWPTGAMAVATNDQDLTFPFSMLALNTTACKAIAVSGGGVVEAYENVQSNSNGSGCAPADPVGFSRTGGATINVVAPSATCRVVGEFQDNGSGPPINCTIVENSFALPDPLRNLPDPTKPALAAPMVYAGTGTAPTIPPNCPGSLTDPPDELAPALCKIPATGGSANISWILYPGLYPGGLQVDKDRTVYLMPGIYWIGGGGVDIGGGGSIVTIGTETDATSAPDVGTNPCATGTTPDSLCGGVMFFNTKLPGAVGGPFILNSSGATMKLASLDLPTGDPDAIYNHVTIFQDRTLTNPVTLNGSSSFTIVEGIIYVPAAQIKLNGNGGTLILDQVIADTYDINGNGGTIKVLRGEGVDAVIVAAGLVD
jgi:hypothetical protein